MAKKTTLEGTCPACFRTMALVEPAYNGDLRIGRHGWQESGGRQVGVYGQAWHQGACFGVGHKPFEVSPEGTIAFLEQVVFPSTLNAENRVAHLAGKPPIYLEHYAYGRAGGWGRTEKYPYTVRYQRGDVYTREVYTGDLLSGYETVWEREFSAAGHALSNAMREGRELCARVAGWKLGKLSERKVKGPVVHYLETGARKPACVRLRYPAGMRTTNEREHVTCVRCRKAIGA